MQLASAAAAELYYAGQYAELVKLVTGIQRDYAVEAKFDGSLSRWVERCAEQLSAVDRAGGEEVT